ncbi:MAG: lipid-A-disaccharide synthase, partial [Bacteroidales bacterium]
EADPQARFRYMGGDRMEEVAKGRVVHYRETNYMMLDVLLHLRKIFRTMRMIREEIFRWQPDVVIPVDYPGFNLRMSKVVHSRGIPVFYYISPKVWAWKQRRVQQLKRYTDRLFVILPFEVGYFRRFGMEVEYLGNPLVDPVAGYLKEFEGKEEWKNRLGLGHRPLVALLAGSRKKEIEAVLPLMVRLAEEDKDHHFVVAGAPSIEPAFYEPFINGTPVGIVFGETYGLLASSVGGIVTSGTATLEAAMFGLPQVVVYKTGWPAYTLAKWIIKVNFISLVNLIHGRELVKELIQKDLYRRMKNELDGILKDPSVREAMQAGYREILGKLGEEGVLSRTGKRMVELIKTEAA